MLWNLDFRGRADHEEEVLTATQSGHHADYPQQPRSI